MELAAHAVKALRKAAQGDDGLTAESVSVGIVGKGLAFRQLTTAELEQLVRPRRGDARRRLQMPLRWAGPAWR